MRAAAFSGGRAGGPELGQVEVDSGTSSDEAGVAAIGSGGVTYALPEKEVANAEEALALAPEGSSEAEPLATVGRSRPTRDRREGALTMHRTRRTVHRASCRFVRRMADAAKMTLLSVPAASWQRCRFCCPP